MRAASDTQSQHHLLQLGDGIEQSYGNDLVRIPDKMIVPWIDMDSSINQLLELTFAQLQQNIQYVEYMMSHVLLALKNETIHYLNDFVLEQLPGNKITYYSFDSDPEDIYQPDFFNTFNISGFPPHQLNLKKGIPIILLRTINRNLGLCNGTRLICKATHRHIIEAELVFGPQAGIRVFIPRFTLQSSTDSGLSFVLQRKQFPVQQLLLWLLTRHKLYVALSRSISSQNTKASVQRGKLENQPGIDTKNIVYKEDLRLCGSHV
ncbi:uncharacterized protein LOC143850234 [Tasmannia lanceolata]|uniref:uncharacterized protein LOC143850234 n=1 Tax=Tasmannia lanceolata TaxID=3420 RepID=UPI004063D8F1